MNDKTATPCIIHGTVAPGFETVKALYERQMHTKGEKNTQLCVYYQGKKIVDLWASATADSSFSADSLVTVFSSGKSLEAIAMASLVSKGLLSYSDLIVKYWPEFAANGKDKLTVADLMRHEAGLANFDTSLNLEDLLTENIKQNSVGRVIERHAQNYTGAAGGKRQYHALTRGWIANELYRRVDPTGRTIGEYIREDISGPLQADAYIGLKKHELPRVSKVYALRLGELLRESLKSRRRGRGTAHNAFQIFGRVTRFLPTLIKRKKAGAPPPFVSMAGSQFFNSPNLAMGETPSANASCSARGLAKIAAMMSAGGKWQGREYLSEHAWNALHQHPLKAIMGGLVTTQFTQGGIDSFTACDATATRDEQDLNNGRQGFFGWMGLGGSIFQWHPKLDIGFAFVPTSLHVVDVFNERGKQYQSEILNCIARMEHHAN
jgi:CubicO group peptidase (beta-lactamase class C family)